MIISSSSSSSSMFMSVKNNNNNNNDNSTITHCTQGLQAGTPIIVYLYSRSYKVLRIRDPPLIIAVSYHVQKCTSKGTWRQNSVDT